MDEIKCYFEEMQSFQQYFLYNYLEKDHYQEELYSFIDTFPDIIKNRYKLKCMLHIITKISNNHYHSDNFWPKIEAILILLKNDILQNFSNEEIFVIFKSNKRIILFLFQETILIPQISFFNTFKWKKYNDNFFYFFNEYQPFCSKTLINNIKKAQQLKILFDDPYFNRKRQIGENTDEICKLIQNDSIDEFISYVNKKDVSFNTKIKPTLFESNLYLIKNHPTLIEYSAFYGSIHIFKYLYQNNVDISPSIFYFAIHGNNYEIIHIIEENFILNDEDYYNCFIESVKCHHNDLVEYYYDRFQHKSNENNVKLCLKYYNFECISKIAKLESIAQPNLLYEFCHYDHFIPTQVLLNDIDLTKKILTNNYYLLVSVEKQNIDIVKLLLQHPKIDVNQTFKFEDNIKFEKNALVCAAQQNNLEIFQLLLNQKNINVNKKIVIKNLKYMIHIEKNALSFANDNNNIDIFRLLLERKEFKINEMLTDNEITKINKRTILYEAVKKGNFDIVQLMLNHPKIDVKGEFFNFKDDTILIMTLLHCAIKHTNNDIIKLLINHKDIDVNYLVKITCTNSKKIKITPLGLAIIQKNIGAIKLLLTNQKIDVNKVSIFANQKDNGKKLKELKSPLQLAIETDDINIVNIIFNNQNVDINKNCLFFVKESNTKKLIIVTIAFAMIIIIILAIYIIKGDDSYASNVIIILSAMTNLILITLI